MAVIADINDFFESETKRATDFILDTKEIINATEKQIIYWESRKKAMQEAQAFVKNYGG